MTRYKYFSYLIRVKLTNDETVTTTITAIFQRRLLGIFWKSVSEVNFAVYDYSKSEKGFGINYRQSEEGNPSTYYPVTITYTKRKSLELWMPEYFNLEDSLEKHSQKYVETKSA